MPTCFSHKKDRRNHPRSQTSTKVYLSCDGAPRLPGQVKDLSAAGALVDVGCLPVGNAEVVELAFVLPFGAITKIRRRSAIVVRRSASGIGLMFLERCRADDD